MRDEFLGFYSPTSAELDRVWDEGEIVLDTNALLNLFRYSARTRDELLALLRKDSHRLWIPHQVAGEFLRLRRGIPSEQALAFDSVIQQLSTAADPVRASIAKLERHPALEAEELSALLDKHLRKLRKGIKKARDRHFASVIGPEAHDRTLEAVSELYKGRVGPAYSDVDLEKVHSDAAKRYAKKVPPGYRDADQKKDERKYGDYVLWRQLLDHADTTKKPVIFVTDDGKDDWWEQTFTGGVPTTHGPRPELVEEFLAVSGERIHFWETRDFLAFAKKRGEAISDAAVKEARTVSSTALNDSIIAAGRRLVDSGVLGAMDRVLADVNPDRLAGVQRALAAFAEASNASVPRDALAQGLADLAEQNRLGLNRRLTWSAMSESERKLATYQAALRVAQTANDDRVEKARRDAELDLAADFEDLVDDDSEESD